MVTVDPIPGDESSFVIKSIFLCFSPMMKGLLKGYKPIIRMDGYHLKGTAGGVLLSAMSRDNNNQMFLGSYCCG